MDMTPTSINDIVSSWVEAGWVRELDRAFMRFIQHQDPLAEGAVLLAALLTSHQLGRGHICLDLHSTLQQSLQTLDLPPEELRYPSGAKLLPTAPDQVLNSIMLGDWLDELKKTPLISEGAGSSPLVLDGSRLYMRRYWAYEQTVAHTILARIQETLSPPQHLDQDLKALFTVEHNRPTGTSELINWQKIACALATRSRFTVITGGPGTGKTYSVVRLLAILQKASEALGHTPRILLAAPTGKAAARLTESIGRSMSDEAITRFTQSTIPTTATTLHRLLGARPDTRRFRYHRHNPIHADLVIVDEASMIDLEMMAALLEALQPHTQLVLLGDKDQLASVEAGSVLGDLCEGVDDQGYPEALAVWLTKVTGDTIPKTEVHESALSPHIVKLKISRRFTQKSGIGALAQAINQGDHTTVQALLSDKHAYPDIARIQPNEQGDHTLDRIVVEGGLTAFASKEDNSTNKAIGYRHYLNVLHQLKPHATAKPSELEPWALEVLKAFDRYRVLCALKLGPYGVEGLNHLIAERLVEEGLIDTTQSWYEGRPVLVTRNEYALGLVNGDIGMTLRIPIGQMNAPTGPLRVAFPRPEGGVRFVSPSRLNAIETVFAMTVHKSQGSEFDHVSLVLPDKVNPIVTRELVYTGVTRAKHWLSMLVADDEVLNQAITRRIERSGGLRHLMK